MPHVWAVTLLGLFAGVVGTGLGGLISIFMRNSHNKTISFLLQLSGGIMIGVVCFDLVPNALEVGNIWVMSIGMLIGVATIVLTQQFVNRHNKNRKNSNILKVGLIMAIGIAMHNFPEGLAIGVAFDVRQTLGVSLMIAMMLHDIPEGAVIGLPMKAGGASGVKVLTYTLIAGVPTGLGAFIGALIGNVSNAVICGALGMAAGAMLYIVLGELIGEAKSIYKGRLPTLGALIGVVLGLFLSLIE